MGLAKEPGFWRNAEHAFLVRYINDLLFDFDNFLVQAGYSINTRKAYLNLVGAAVRRCDIRNEMVFREYILQFADSTRHARNTARNTFLLFINADLKKNAFEIKHTVRQTREERQKELYKRKLSAFERAAMDVIQGIEDGIIEETLEAILERSRKMLAIRRKYNVEPSYQDMDTSTISIPTQRKTIPEDYTPVSDTLSDFADDSDKAFQEENTFVAIDSILDNPAVAERLVNLLGLPKEELAKIEAEDPKAFANLVKRLTSE